jgi:hypothetical protein
MTRIVAGNPWTPTREVLTVSCRDVTGGLPRTVVFVSMSKVPGHGCEGPDRYRFPVSDPYERAENPRCDTASRES